MNDIKMKSEQQKQRDRELFIEDEARKLCDMADKLGVILTIERAPLTPFAMGHHAAKIEVRAKRGGAK